MAALSIDTSAGDQSPASPKYSPVTPPPYRDHDVVEVRASIPSMHRFVRDRREGNGASREAVVAALLLARPEDGERLLRRFERVYASLHWDTAACFVRSLPLRCTDSDVKVMSDATGVAHRGGMEARKGAIFKWLRANFLLSSAA